jgi:hypothetical protein
MRKVLLPYAVVSPDRSLHNLGNVVSDSQLVASYSVAKDPTIPSTACTDALIFAMSHSHRLTVKHVTHPPRSPGKSLLSGFYSLPDSISQL